MQIYREYRGMTEEKLLVQKTLAQRQGAAERKSRLRKRKARRTASQSRRKNR